MELNYAVILQETESDTAQHWLMYQAIYNRLENTRTA